MATRTENIRRIRSLLDEPMPGRPSFDRVFAQELSAEADVLNATNNTNRPWAVSTTQLNYTPGSTEYQLSVTDFGKPLFVTRIVNNPYITRIPVDFADLNHQRYGTMWQTWDAFYPWGLESTPEKMAFFRSPVMDSAYYVTIEPQPQQAVTYEITYVPRYTGGDDPLESAIQLPEMAELVQLRSAAALLSYCRWTDDRKEDSAHKEELKQGFIFQLSIKEPIFQRYIASMTQPKDVEVSSWQTGGW